MLPSGGPRPGLPARHQGAHHRRDHRAARSPGRGDGSPESHPCDGCADGRRRRAERPTAGHRRGQRDTAAIDWSRRQRIRRIARRDGCAITVGGVAGTVRGAVRAGEHITVGEPSDRCGRSNPDPGLDVATGQLLRVARNRSDTARRHTGTTSDPDGAADASVNAWTDIEGDAAADARPDGASDPARDAAADTPADAAPNAPAHADTDAGTGPSGERSQAAVPGLCVRSAGASQDRSAGRTAMRPGQGKGQGEQPRDRAGAVRARLSDPDGDRPDPPANRADDRPSPAGLTKSPTSRTGKRATRTTMHECPGSRAGRADARSTRCLRWTRCSPRSDAVHAVGHS